jgi:hypothetical protein
MASLLAWSLRETRVRLAFAILAVQQATLAYGLFFGTSISGWLSGGLSVASAILLIWSASATVPSWPLVAPAVFAAMFLFRWVTLYYADGIIGRHSVFRSGPFC